MEHWYLILTARHREHAEALLEDLMFLHRTLGWPKPMLFRVVVDPALPPGQPPMVAEAALETPISQNTETM